MNEPNPKELRALDALIAGALLPEMKCANLSNEELDVLIAQSGKALPEDIAALEKLGNPFLEMADRPSGKAAECSVGEMAMAMNRKNISDKLSEQTRAELERRARQLLG